MKFSGIENDMDKQISPIKLEIAMRLLAFSKLHPKKFRVSEYDPRYNESYMWVRDMFKDHLSEINPETFDHCFYDKDKNYLTGKKWIDIFVNSDSIDEYHNKFALKYKYCDQSFFMDVIENFIYTWEKNEPISIIKNVRERQLGPEINKKLREIKHFYQENNWTHYLTAVQTMLQKAIMDFTGVKSSNYSSYAKPFLKKISMYMPVSQVEMIHQWIQAINTFRNAIVKPSTTGKEKQELRESFNSAPTEIQRIRVNMIYNYLVSILSVIHAIDKSLELKKTTKDQVILN